MKATRFLFLIILLMVSVAAITSCQYETVTPAPTPATPLGQTPPPAPPIQPPPSSTPAKEEQSLPGATVAFMRYTNDSWDEYIYLIEADGTGLRKLTPDKNVRESFPQFSPDGQKIVFSRMPKGGLPNVWLMNTDGTGRVALTDVEWADMPAWSPDGKHIAFVSRQGSQLEISVMASDGSNINRLTNDISFDVLPVWSPDGTRIAFLSDRAGTYRWWVINADGSGEQLLADIKIYEKDVSVPLILLRGVWGRDTLLSGEYFMVPRITKDERMVISIDVQKGTRGFLTFGDIQNLIEVQRAGPQDATRMMGTFWSKKSNSFDIVDVFSGGETVVGGPENDLASSSMILKK